MSAAAPGRGAGRRGRGGAADGRRQTAARGRCGCHRSCPLRRRRPPARRRAPRRSAGPAAARPCRPGLPVSRPVLGRARVPASQRDARAGPKGGGSARVLADAHGARPCTPCCVCDNCMRQVSPYALSIRSRHTWSTARAMRTLLLCGCLMFRVKRRVIGMGGWEEARTACRRAPRR